MAYKLQVERPKTIQVSFKMFKILSAIKFSKGYSSHGEVIEDLFKTSSFCKVCDNCKFENLMNNKTCSKCGRLI